MLPWPRYCIALLLAGSFMLAPRPQIVVVEDVNLSYRFADQLSVSAKLAAPNSLSGATLYIKPEDQSPLQVRLVIGQDGMVHQDVDLKENELTPFARTYYWFQVFFRDGQSATSAAYWFDYDDNRFEWQDLTAAPITVYWTGRDAGTGQQIMDVAQRAIQASASLPLSSDVGQIRIYAYTGVSDLPTLVRPSWADGHAIPDIGVILLSLDSHADELGFQLERQIPHELMHIRLWRAMRETYPSLPAWLVEGLAVNAELYPNPEYERALRDAVRANGLLDMQALCSGFPSSGSGALLAYAQSASFVRFLQNRYGNSGINSLLQQYADYKSCADGPRAAFGMGLDQLQADWHNDSLHLYSASYVTEQILPYALIGVLALGSVGAATWAGIRVLNRARPHHEAQGGQTDREK